MARRKDERSPNVLWRELVRDSGLDKMTKLVAYTLASYFNGEMSLPQQRSMQTIASDASASKRAVSTCVNTLERCGLVRVTRSKPSFDKNGKLVRGHDAHVYNLRFPHPTLHHIPRREGTDVASGSTLTWQKSASDVARLAHELENTSTRNGTSTDARPYREWESHELVEAWNTSTSRDPKLAEELGNRGFLPPVFDKNEKTF